MVIKFKFLILLIGFGVLGPSLSASSKPIWTKQNWSVSDEKKWYGLSQGSRLIPFDWFMNLRDVETKKPFASRENLQRFGYPYYDPSAKLPIGFVIDKDKSKGKALGFNCAACHTSQLSYGGKEVLIHGGQNFADFRAFLTSLTRSVRELVSKPKSVAVFYTAINGNGGSDGEVSTLTDQLTKWLAHRKEIDRVLIGTEPWGPGRADAVAYIQAAAAKVVQLKPAKHVSPANAPVNYPHVWNTNQQERLQHNGLVSNGASIGAFGQTKIGAYIRNYTEALGVFSEVTLSKDDKISSTIRVGNLLEIERTLAKLKSPKWPAKVFGTINETQAFAGKAIFERQCSSCHADLDRNDLTTLLPLKKRGQTSGPFILVQPVVDVTLTRRAQLSGYDKNPALIGTDPMMVCNFLTHTSSTGKLEGKKKKNTLYSMAYFDVFRKRVMTTEILAALVIRDLKAKSKEIALAQAGDEIDGLKTIFYSWFDKKGQGDGQTYSYSDPKDPKLTRLNSVLSNCANFAEAMHQLDSKSYPYPGYKTRPLNGIWASPPYLHNGSVPTMYDLLSTQEKRPAKFRVGRGEFDPKKLGLAKPKNNSVHLFRVYDKEGEVILGNWNGGHEYGTDLSDDEKYALIEYIKGL